MLLAELGGSALAPGGVPLPYDRRVALVALRSSCAAALGLPPPRVWLFSLVSRGERRFAPRLLKDGDELPEACLVSKRTTSETVRKHTPQRRREDPACAVVVVVKEETRDCEDSRSSEPPHTVATCERRKDSDDEEEPLVDEDEDEASEEETCLVVACASPAREGLGLCLLLHGGGAVTSSGAQPVPQLLHYERASAMRTLRTACWRAAKHSATTDVQRLLPKGAAGPALLADCTTEAPSKNNNPVTNGACARRRTSRFSDGSLDGFFSCDGAAAAAAAYERGARQYEEDGEASSGSVSDGSSSSSWATQERRTRRKPRRQRQDAAEPAVPPLKRAGSCEDSFDADPAALVVDWRAVCCAAKAAHSTQGEDRDASLTRESVEFSDVSQLSPAAAARFAQTAARLAQAADVAAKRARRQQRTTQRCTKRALREYNGVSLFWTSAFFPSRSKRARSLFCVFWRKSSPPWRDTRARGSVSQRDAEKRVEIDNETRRRSRGGASRDRDRLRRLSAPVAAPSPAQLRHDAAVLDPAHPF